MFHDSFRACTPSLGDEGFLESLPPLTTPLGLARLLGLDPRWLRDEAAGGRIPALRVGRRCLFHPAAVVQALAERAKQGGPLPASQDGGEALSQERGGGL